MTILLTLIFFILLLTNDNILIFGALANTDWKEGDELKFEIYQKTVKTEINKELDLKSEEETIYENEELVTIIYVYEDIWEALVNLSYYDGYYGYEQFNFDGMDMARDDLTSRDFLSVHYTYDDNTQDILLTSFRCIFSPRRFIKVDWTTFNNHFKGVFDDNNILDSVTTPSGNEEITVSEFLGSISYSICGKKDIIKARNQFTATRTKWVMTFDLSDILHFYDHDEREFIQLNRCLITTHIEYTPGGILRKYQYRWEYQYETDKEEVEYYSEVTKTLGGVKKIPILFVFITVGFSIVALAIIRIRKKNVC